MVEGRLQWASDVVWGGPMLLNSIRWSSGDGHMFFCPAQLAVTEAEHCITGCTCGGRIAGLAPWQPARPGARRLGSSSLAAAAAWTVSSFPGSFQALMPAGFEHRCAWHWFMECSSIPLHCKLSRPRTFPPATLPP